MAAEDEMLATGRRIVNDLRSRGAGLDGTDESMWFVQGVLNSMHERGETAHSDRGAEKLAYAVYVADLLASTCADVTARVQMHGDAVSDVVAVQGEGEGEVFQFVLSWVLKCVDDPDPDNIVFKYAGALQDFGEQQRAQILYDQLDDYRQNQ